MSFRYTLLMIVCGWVATPAFGAEFLYATQDTSARRFSDAETPTSLEVKAGTRLEVIFRKGDLVRVRPEKEDKFGWIPVLMTSTEAPPAPTTDATGAPAGDALVPPLVPAP